MVFLRSTLVWNCCFLYNLLPWCSHALRWCEIVFVFSIGTFLLVSERSTLVWNSCFFANLCRGVYTFSAGVKRLFLYELLSWCLHAQHLCETVAFIGTFAVVFTCSTLVWNCRFYRNLFCGVYTLNTSVKLLFLYEPLPLCLHAQY